MKNTSLEKEKIRVDFTEKLVPASVKNFMPDIYRDGDRFICVLGSDQYAVSGEGASIEEAMEAWDNAYHSKK